MITNPNEITKSEFDELNRINEFDIFTPYQISLVTAEIAKLVKKGETLELSDEELDIIKSGTSELKGLTKYTINEMQSGRIVKNDVFVQPKQVKWFETLEKSLTGDNITKGIFLDTPLNRELNRVGVTFEKGKAIVKSEDEDKKEESQEDKMIEAIKKSLKKSDGDDEEVKKAIKKAFPEADDKEIDKAMKKAYKGMADDFMKKAEEDDYEEKAEEDEIKKEEKE
jgi:hypothetical protein